jgi:hypothetical protein
MYLVGLIYLNQYLRLSCDSGEIQARYETLMAWNINMINFWNLKSYSLVETFL